MIPPTRAPRGHIGDHTLNSMTRPEFTGTGAVFAPLNQLPPMVRLFALGLLLVVAMGGCTAAWIDQQSYVPSPNVCRSDQIRDAARLGCVVPQRVPAEVQR